jgi:hypothetical protein
MIAPLGLTEQARVQGSFKIAFSNKSYAKSFVVLNRESVKL